MKLNVNYKTKGEPLKLGAGTRVEILNISHDPYVRLNTLGQPLPPPAPGYIPIRITATLRLTAEVTVLDNKQCSVCNAKPGLPDTVGMWFLMENHDDDRLVFPDEEKVAPERDCYPVSGWEILDDNLLCPKCVTDVRDFLRNKKTKATKPR